MKIILSRKGLDSSFGNYPSIIMPDSKLCWLPIPEINESKNLYTYEDLSFDKSSLGDVVESLSSGKISRNNTVHLDPDIFPFYVDREKGWEPLFGQTGAAESHLRNQDVKAGDIFLFFAWYKESKLEKGKLKYNYKTSDLHILYGWFQIRKKVLVNGFSSIESWMKNYTHFQGDPYHEKLDTVYFPTEYLTLNGKKTNLKGCGYFPYFHPDLVLTAPNSSRSIWQLPNWFYPLEGKTPLSYHHDLSRWDIQSDSVILRSASRGQEFVLNSSEYPESVSWITSLIDTHGDILWK